MGFVKKINFLDHRPPGKAYLHTFGLSAAYSNIYGDDPTIKAGCYIRNILSEHHKRFEYLDFLLGVLWGDDGEKVMNLFGLEGMGRNWHREPVYLNWTFKEGERILIPEMTRGDGIIMLGCEELFRKGTANIDEYIEKKDLPLLNNLTIEAIDL